LKPKRTPYEMVWEILEYCAKPKRLTHIIQGCNLNTNSAKRYINLLVRKGLLKEKGEYYLTTETGTKYLKLIEEVYKGIFLEE